MAEPKKWMQGLDIKKGALRSKLGTPAGKKIPVSELHKAAAKSGKEGKEARLALVFRKADKSKKK